MRKIKTSQAALEFLTIYGWVFLVVIIVIAALYSLRVLSPGNFVPNSCRAGQEFGCMDFTVSSSAVRLRLKNNAGSPVIIKSIGIPGCSGNVFSESRNMILGSGEIGDFTIGLCNNLAEQYRNEIEINYSKVSGFDQSVHGNIFSRSSSGNINYDYLNANSQNLDGLVAAYDFNEGDGYMLNDISGNGNAGTIYGNTGLIMNFDNGNADDISVYNNDGTLNGGVNCNAQGISASGCSFDSSDDFISVDSASLQMTDFVTIEAWINPTGNGGGASGTGGIIINKEGEYEMARFTDGSIRFALANSVPGWTWVNTGYVAPLNSWAHIALTYSASAQISNFYVDGQLYFSSQASGPITDYHTSENEFRIGNRQNSCCTDQYFQGIIDEVGIYSKAISSTEIAEHYNSRKAKFTDWEAGKYGNAMNFDALDDYINVPHQASLNGNSELTYEAWFKINSFNKPHNQIIGKSVHGGGQGRAQMGIWFNPTGTVQGRAETADGRYEIIGPIITTNNWHHVVLVFNQTTLRFYLAGNRIGELNFPATTLVENSDPLRLGCDYDRCNFPEPPTNQAGDYIFDGKIDSIAIYNRALTEEEISAHAVS